jgi:hypothetical protein
MFMDGRFLNVARIGFGMIMSKNYWDWKRIKKLEINDKFLIKIKRAKSSPNELILAFLSW